MKILVAYCSKTGNTKKMAEAITQGAKKEGAEVDLKDVKDIKPSNLLDYHAIMFGSPTYYGLMAAEMKKLLDDSVKHHGELSGKIGGAFSSAGGIGGGGETTILSIIQAFLIHGMIIIGESGSYHYGPLSIKAPNDKVLNSCIEYGQKIAVLTKKVFKE
jgi:NAD(P)H dehydrogenase (quinone)